MDIFACSYCKGFGHFKSTCLKLLTKESPFCRDYNRFLESSCQFQNHPESCLLNREHRCSICFKSGCKAYFHIYHCKSFDSSQGAPYYTQFNNMKSLISKLEALLQQISEKLFSKSSSPSMPLAKPFVQTPTPNASSPTQPFVLPHTGIPTVPVTSVDEKVDMAISTGFSLSAVSEDHALKILKASDPCAPSPRSSVNVQFHAVNNNPFSSEESIIVPITFSNGRRFQFQMVVIPNLTNDIVFGFNHLQKTDAVINYAKGVIDFRDEAINFTVNFSSKEPPDNSLFAWTSLLVETA